MTASEKLGSTYSASSSQLIRHDEVLTSSCPVLTLSRLRERVGVRGCGFILIRAASIVWRRARRIGLIGGHARFSLARRTQLELVLQRMFGCFRWRCLAVGCR